MKEDFLTSAAKNRGIGLMAEPTGRSSRRRGWVSRREAARMARVHYNTIRSWERQEWLRTKDVPGPSGREIHVSIADLKKVLAGRPERPAEAPAVDRLAPEIRELQRENLALREEVARLRGQVKVFEEVIDRIIGVLGEGEGP
jgi:DNA-binding transcriptional MerR regulator